MKTELLCCLHLFEDVVRLFPFAFIWFYLLPLVVKNYHQAKRREAEAERHLADCEANLKRLEEEHRKIFPPRKT